MSRDGLESNARIFGILSIIFSIVPILGLTFGVIATQKGRKGISSFAVNAGCIGITLSLILAIIFGYWRYTSVVNEQKETRYKQCIQDRLKSFSTDGVYVIAEAQCDWARP